MVSWSGLASRKYGIQQQDANTRAQAERNASMARFQDVNQRGIGIRADANLANTRAGLLPGQIANESALTAARARALDFTMQGARAEEADPLSLPRTQARQNLAQAALLGETARETRMFNDMSDAPPALDPTGATVRSGGAGGIGQPFRFGYLGLGPAGLARQQADDERRRRDDISRLPLGFAAGTERVPQPTPEQRETARRMRTGLAIEPPADDRILSPRPAVGMAKGATRVPGKGSGKVDTVPAVLAPGEAVLNKAAADKMGRGMIARLNKAGARKMGMV